MPRKSNGKSQQLIDRSIRIYEIEFVIQKDGKKAMVEMSYQKTIAKNTSDEQTKMSVYSVWVDDIKNKVVMAFIKPNLRNPQHHNFYKTLRKIEFAKCPQTGMIMTASRDGVILYGPKPGWTYSDTDTTNYESYEVYQTKSDALLRILQDANKYVTIAGLEESDTSARVPIDFTAVSNSVLIELGLVPVFDELKRGRTMWRGDVSSAFTGSRYGWQPRQDKLKKINLFLESLQQDLLA